MEITVGLIIIAGFYLWFLFLDHFFKSCCHYGYIQFLRNTGLEIRLFQIKWSTNALNYLITKLGSPQKRFKRQLLDIWFEIGAVFSLLLLPTAVCSLLYSLYYNITMEIETSRPGEFENQNTENKGRFVLEPLLPGINLPFSEIGYYSLTLLLSSVVHELGHSLAASRDNVPTLEVGANIMFVLPVAYVILSTDRLNALSKWKQLKVLTGGVWHNLVLSLVAYLVLCSLNVVFIPIYRTGNGVLVTRVASNSILAGARGLKYGDTVVGINDCVVRDEGDWFNCLKGDGSGAIPSFCVSGETLRSFGTTECCPNSASENVKDSRESSGRLCFEYKGETNRETLPSFVCLPGRHVITHSQFCNGAKQCETPNFCYKPVMANGTNLFKIKRISSYYSKPSTIIFPSTKDEFGAVVEGVTDNFDVIFIGLSMDLRHEVDVSSYVPRFSFINSFPHHIPDVLVKFLSYCIIFSLGLAIINILPCLCMDGQYIADVLLEFLLVTKLRKSSIQIISKIVSSTFLLLIIVHCIFTLYIKYL